MAFDIQSKPNDVAAVLTVQLIAAVVEVLAGLGLMIYGSTFLTQLASGFVGTYLIPSVGILLGLGFIVMGFIRMLVVYHASEQGEYARGLLILLSVLGILSMNWVSFAIGVLTIAIIAFGESESYWTTTRY